MSITGNNNFQSQLSTEIEDLRAIIKNWKKEGHTIGFVPTMGALHVGHESLIKEAKKHCSKVVVSIFVNPTQFGPNEDYNKYPRTLEKDMAICANNTVDIVFSPTVSEMYPEIENLTGVCPPENFQNKLCGLTRAGHFDGVATVVLKLLNIVQPDKAFFGQKDAQQLIIIKKICLDLNIPVEIIGCPIIRDADGLAISSRNIYLSLEAREKALSLSRVLKKIQELYSNKITDKQEILIAAKKIIHPDVELEYLEINNINTLEPLNKVKSGSLIAIAARVDGVRLIDNIIIE